MSPICILIVVTDPAHAGLEFKSTFAKLDQTEYTITNEMIEASKQEITDEVSH